MPPKSKKHPKSQTTGDAKKINHKKSSSYRENGEEYETSSAYSDSALVFKTEDVRQKLMIARNIALKCKKIKTNIIAGKLDDINNEPLMKRLHEYTNLPTSELKVISHNVIKRDRSFAKTMTDIRPIREPTSSLLADDLRTIFIKYIVDQKQFPSKTDVLKDLKLLASQYSNDSVTIQRLIKNNLIKYQHFPEFNRYLLCEHPEKIYQRTVYLNSLKTLRSQHRDFVYVEVRRMLPRGTASGFIAGLAAIPSSDKLEKFFTKDSPHPIATKWLQQRILPIIPAGSVVILAQPNSRNKLTPLGKRYDFISWLDKNGIPYGRNPHTAELFSLITKFKGNIQREGIYDHIFVNAGHTLVHFPSEWRNLNFFKFIWADVIVMDAFHPGRPELLKQKILNATSMFSKLKEEEQSLIEEEFKMIKEDSVMEEIMENVHEMVKKGEVQTLDFPKELCEDKTDYFETHVFDFVVEFTHEV